MVELSFPFEELVHPKLEDLHFREEGKGKPWPLLRPPRASFARSREGALGDRC